MSKEYKIPKSMIIEFVIPRQKAMKEAGLNKKEWKRIGVFKGITKDGYWRVQPWGLKTTYSYWKGFWKKVDHDTWMAYKKKFKLRANKNAYYKMTGGVKQ